MDQDTPELFAEEIPVAYSCTERGLRRTVKREPRSQHDEHEPAGWIPAARRQQQSLRSIPEDSMRSLAFDLCVEHSALMAATQRPLSELAFSEPTGVPAWKKDLPSWAVVASGDKVVGTDAVRSMADRGG